MAKGKNRSRVIAGHQARRQMKPTKTGAPAASGSTRETRPSLAESQRTARYASIRRRGLLSVLVVSLLLIGTAVTAGLTGIVSVGPVSDRIPAAVEPGSVNTVIDLRTDEARSSNPLSANLDTVSRFGSAVTVLDGRTYAVAVTSSGSAIVELNTAAEGSRVMPAPSNLSDLVSLSEVSFEPSATDFAKSVDPLETQAPPGVIFGSNKGLRLLIPDDYPKANTATPFEGIALYPRFVGGIDVETLEPILPDYPYVVDQVEDGHGKIFSILKSLDGAERLVQLPISTANGSEPVPEPVVASSTLDPRPEYFSAVSVTRDRTLIVADQHGRRLLQKSELASDFEVIYEVGDGQSSIRDLAVDELGNIYYSAETGIFRLDRFGSIAPVWSVTVSGQSAMTPQSITDPKELAFTPSGNLLVTHSSGLAISSIAKVSGLWETPSVAQGWYSWPPESTLGLEVTDYCICSGGSPVGTSFVKAKIAMRNMSTAREFQLDPSSLFLLVLYKGNPNLSVNVQRVASGDEEEGREPWSGRILSFTSADDTRKLEALQSMSSNGQEYSLYALPSNPVDVVIKDASGQIGFASEFSSEVLRPMSEYYDSRASYGSLVFYVPTKNSNDTPLRPIIAGIGYWEGSSGTWLSVAGVERWGIVGAPWSF
jgi:hypothetical protein